jgi:hypothetical protein
LLLTLLAVPVFYSLFEDGSQHPVWQRISGRFGSARTATARRLQELSAPITGSFRRQRQVQE